MSTIWFRECTVVEAQRLECNTFANHIGVEFTEIGSNYLAGRMALAPHMKQPFGVLHGGASVALAETLGSVAANFTVDPDRYRCVGQSITAHHLRPVPVQGGYVHGVARPVHRDERRQSWTIELRRDDSEVFCVSTLIMAVVPQKPRS
jgi:1,4-dihydroxy-2-naphthoyl-CoA hydrolase